MITLCQLATKLPGLIGALLDRESKLKRGRFREETLTDIVTASLAAFAGPSMVIEYPDEAVTGGDLDLDFWHVSSGQHLRLRIQAKRLNAKMNNNKSVAVEHRAYNELLHVVPSTKVYQYKTLVNSAGPFLPLYMFYNHTSVVGDRYFRGAKPAVNGINLAFAEDISAELDAKVSAKPKRLHHKRLSHLRPHFFELSTIFCASLMPGDDVPSPDTIAHALEQKWLETVYNVTKSDADRAGRWLSLTPFIRQAEESDRRIPDGPPIRFTPDIERPTITFLSGRTDDERTPNIKD